MAPLSRRSRTRLLLLSYAPPLAGLLHSSSASALQFGTPAEEHPARSAQNVALELRASPYYPAIDEEPGLHGTPFHKRFGDAPRLALGIEVDWQALRVPFVGTLGPGLGAGIVSMSRRATTLKGAPSGDEYGLTIYPMYLAGVLRADALYRDLGIPVIPFFKGGVGLGVWRAWNSGGTAHTPNGVEGRGLTWGTLVAVGVGFPLDVLDPTAARAVDVAVGINSTHLFAEYYWLSLDGLFQQRALYVGTKSWAVGLAFEM